METFPLNNLAENFEVDRSVMVTADPSAKGAKQKATQPLLLPLHRIWI